MSNGKRQFRLEDSYALSAIDVDSYQRGRKERIIDEMAANFDHAKCGVVHLAERNQGKTFVIDGQQRIAAAIKRGLTHLPALVEMESDKPREAELFYDINNGRTKVEPVPLFNARVEAGDPIAMEIMGILHEFHLDLGNMSGAGSGTRGWVLLAAVKAVEEVHGWGYLRETLYCILSSFPEDSGALQRQVLLAVGSIYENYGALVDTERLIGVLQKHGRLVLEQSAIGMKGAMGGSLWPHLAQLILHEYNAGLSEKGGNRLEHYRRPGLTRKGNFRFNTRSG